MYNLQAIMMVESADGTHALLGRSRGHRPGMLTCLSGFIDQAESIGERSPPAESNRELLLPPCDSAQPPVSQKVLSKVTARQRCCPQQPRAMPLASLRPLQAPANPAAAACVTLHAVTAAH